MSFYVRAYANDATWLHLGTPIPSAEGAFRSRGVACAWLAVAATRARMRCLTYCDRPYGALKSTDVLAITEWQEFR